MLQAHLSDERPDEVTDLHRRASRWYDQNGQPSPAIRHAVAAGDIERAADLVELAIPELQRNRQEATIRGWLDAIPDEVVRMRPVLAVGLIGALMAGNEFEGVEERLRDAERWLEPAARDRKERHAPSEGMVVVDEQELSPPGYVVACARLFRLRIALTSFSMPLRARASNAAN